jgi:sugar O-acyltransferase (sialic acid O-acetyltransferase NeuD family)
MIYLYGASGHAKVIIEIFELRRLKIFGLIDDNHQIKSFLNYPVQNDASILAHNESELIISIGDNATRKKIAEKLAVKFTKAIHVFANISQRAEIGDGTVIMAGAIINSLVRIGKHVIINTNSSIDHDCVIGDYAHISPNAALAGNVVVGEGSHIGIGACVIQGITIGKWATVGAGAVIINDVPDYAIVVGNPGKIIKYLNL